MLAPEEDSDCDAEEPRHRDDAEALGNISRENNRPPKPCQPYTRQDILQYWKICNDRVDGDVDALDLAALQCGFPWYQMSTLEHQIVNIRHIQHHSGQLGAYLRRVEPAWQDPTVLRWVKTGWA